MLILFCDSVRGVIRESDIFGRYGGGEFVFFLSRTNRHKVVGILERISAELESKEIKADDGSKVDISISAGVYCLESSVSADLALYKAKEESRNSTGSLFFCATGD